MTKVQRTAMARIISDMIKADNSLVTLQRQQHFFPSLHGNVAILCMRLILSMSFQQEIKKQINAYE